MSIVLLNADRHLGPVLIRRLVDQDDEVRIVEDDPDRAAQWKELGAHVARGEKTDVDLIARAATNARTIVMLSDDPALATAAVEAARLSSVDRLILSGPKLSSETIAAVTGSGIDHVVLKSRTGGIRRLSVPLEAVAAAIDAADDLAGHPRLVLDLTDRRAWASLAAEKPARGGLEG